MGLSVLSVTPSPGQGPAYYFDPAVLMIVLGIVLVVLGTVSVKVVRRRRRKK